MKKDKKGLGCLGTIVIVLLVLSLLGSCGGGESDYEQDVRNGFEKWSSGDYDSMSDSEREAVNDFLEWSNEN